MPYVKIQSNVDLDTGRRQQVLQAVSSLTASELGKPERYVMVAMDPAMPMMFAGSDAPLAYLELKSIGLPESSTANLSTALCSLINTEMGIDKDRIYIEFADAPRKMWGWNGGTF
jgi:phenylpyruvate tautomerase PptA (4-oxalocrotonate tautomerase family)